MGGVRHDYMQSVCLAMPACLAICLPICLSVCLSVYLTLHAQLITSIRSYGLVYHLVSASITTPALQSPCILGCTMCQLSDASDVHSTGCALDMHYQMIALMAASMVASSAVPMAVSKAAPMASTMASNTA